VTCETSIERRRVPRNGSLRLSPISNGQIISSLSKKNQRRITRRTQRREGSGMARRATRKGTRRPRKTPPPSFSEATGEDGGAAEDARQRAPARQSVGGGFFCCYLLRSLCPRLKGRTYIGFTVNPRRRIRQHNGEISSGAWRTRRGRPWEMVLCIHGFPTNVAALQVRPPVLASTS
jgi:predicted GIY-YIG superfamily endonuclease